MTYYTKFEKPLIMNTSPNEKIIKLKDEVIHLVWTHYPDFPPKERYKKQHALGRELLKSSLKSDYKLEFNEQMLGFNRYGKPHLRNYPDIHFNIEPGRHSGFVK